MLRIVAALLAGLLLCAQTPMLPGFPPGTFQNRAALGAGASGCADANVIAWKAAVVSAGGTVGTTQETNVCTLVTSLKAHSLWTGSDRIWLLSSENTQQSTIDIVALDVATPVSSPTFTFTSGSQGVTGTGTGYLTTTYANGTNYTQNSAAWHVYVRTNRASSNNGTAIGSSDPASTGTNSLVLPLSGGVITWDVNDGEFTDQTANTNAQGFWSGSRTGSTTLNLYKDDSSSAFGTSTQASSSLSGNVPFYFLARNSNGSPSLLSTDQLGIVAFTVGQSGADALQFRRDLNCYMQGLPGNPSVYSSSC